MLKIVRLSLSCLMVAAMSTSVAQQKMHAELSDQAYEARRLARIQAQLSVAQQAAISIGIIMESSATDNDLSYQMQKLHHMKIDIIGILRQNGPLSQKSISDMLWDSGKYPNLAYWSAGHHLNQLRDMGIVKHNKLHSRDSSWELISFSQQEIDEKIAIELAKKQTVKTKISESRKRQKMDTINTIPSIPVAPSPLTLEPTAFSWGLANAPALPSDSFTTDDTTSSSSNMSESALPLPSPVNLLTMPSISFDWLTNQVTDLDNSATVGICSE